MSCFLNQADKNQLTVVLTEDIDSSQCCIYLHFHCFAAAPQHMLCISICRSMTWNPVETHLLTAVCGDSQAIRNQTCCLMFLHQPHGCNRNGHLRGKRKWQKKRKKVHLNLQILAHNISPVKDGNWTAKSNY